jgi:GTP cyclohydrolase II
MTKALSNDVRLSTPHGEFSARLYRDRNGGIGVALWAGLVHGDSPLPSRLHSSCFTSEFLGGADCDCVGQLQAALRAIGEAQRGVVFYLLQEGRGAGLQTKIRDREIVQGSNGAIDTFGAFAQLGLPPDPRTYELVPLMCKDLGIGSALRLMTNNPIKVAALAKAGIEVERVAHDLPSSEHNAQYLHAKARSGHVLRVSSQRYASPPGWLDALDAHKPVLAGFRRAASYSLPMRFRGGTVWFRATGYSHLQSGHDRVVLTYRATHGVAHELRDSYREDLYERLTQSGPQLSRYQAAIARIVDHGAGSILVAPIDAALLSDLPEPDEEADRDLLKADGAARGSTRWEALS